MRLVCLFSILSALIAGESAIVPLPLGGAAAMPFRDEVAGDGRGGWTDQGDNDLRALAPGEVVAGELRFAVGERGIVLADGRIAGWSRTVAVDAGGRSGSAIYLLHASAWTPRGEVAIGNLRLHYADGSSETRTVRSRREVADWWNPVDRLPEAVLAWCGANAQAQVGLYATRIPIPDRPLQRIELEAVGGAVWMVAALSLGADRPLPAVEP
ncbi:MAG: hypothetical protein J0M02_14350, partial [Planctomycetes bacterium]|nr:hypothetical protein [Planctomycetota bacterium]